MPNIFRSRIPAEVNLAISKAGAESGQYISEYNIWMHHLIDDRGRRLFPAKMRLLSHWNLRDEIKADYGDSQNGLAKQRMIEKVMERIVTQTIPAAVINNPQLDWNPATNEVKPAAAKDSDFAPGQRTAVQCSGTQYALSALARSVSGCEAGGSLFAECSHADCAALQRRPATAGGARAKDV